MPSNKKSKKDSNIVVNYLYRDAGNWKKSNCIIFTNFEKLTIPEIESRLTKTLFQGDGFIAEQVDLPKLNPYGDNWGEDDHCWHELSGVEETPEAADDELCRSITELLVSFENAAKIGWNIY